MPCANHRVKYMIFPHRIAPAFHDAILSCLHHAELTPRIVPEAIQMQTIVGLAAAGMGFALVPQSVSL
jgi:DNA-binding transcriptional LysR family regulator